MLFAFLILTGIIVFLVVAFLTIAWLAIFMSDPADHKFYLEDQDVGN